MRRKEHFRRFPHRRQYHSYIRFAGSAGRPQTIDGQFEAIITLRDGATRMDLDNAAKEIIDYARRIELVANDGPKHMRRLVVQWGEAPEGLSPDRVRAGMRPPKAEQ